MPTIGGGEDYDDRVAKIRNRIVRIVDCARLASTWPNLLAEALVDGRLSSAEWEQFVRSLAAKGFNRETGERSAYFHGFCRRIASRAGIVAPIKRLPR